MVVEFKPQVVKLDDIYQTRKYADLFLAKYALLVSSEHIPEEIKRLHRAFPSLLVLYNYQTITMARFDQDTKLLLDWYPRNSFYT